MSTLKEPDLLRLVCCHHCLLRHSVWLTTCSLIQLPNAKGKGLDYGKYFLVYIDITFLASRRYMILSSALHVKSPKDRRSGWPHFFLNSLRKRKTWKAIKGLDVCTMICMFITWRTNNQMKNSPFFSSSVPCRLLSPSIFSVLESISTSGAPSSCQVCSTLENSR